MVKPSSRKRPASRNADSRDGTTEQRILDAAHRVFVRRGTAGARMQDIADEAGVNKALLHYYFRTKNELAGAVFERAAQGIFARLSTSLLGNASLEEKVERIVDVYLSALAAAPFLPAYVLAEFNQHPERAGQFSRSIRAMRQRVLEGLDRQLKAAIRAGTVRPITVQQFIVNLVSLCIFPFAARPMLCAVLDLDARGFDKFIEERKISLPRFFLGALRP